MRALVTGAAGAIGAAIVAGLRQRADEVLAVMRQAPTGRSSSDVRILQADLATAEGLAAVRAAVTGPPLDTVIVAHGIDGSCSFDKLTPDVVRTILDVNAGTVARLFYALRDVLRGGSFVVVSSQAGLVAEPYNVAYCAAKFATVGWVRAIAPTAARDQIMVRTLCPGCTESPLLFGAQARFAAEQGVATTEFVRRRRAGIPLGRFATPEETAASALYLADPDPRRPTVLAATGGEVLY